MVNICGHYLKKQKFGATIWFPEDLENTPLTLSISIIAETSKVFPGQKRQV